jgi:hypothetical protein
MLCSVGGRDDATPPVLEYKIFKQLFFVERMTFQNAMAIEEKWCLDCALPGSEWVALKSNLRPIL